MSHDSSDNTTDRSYLSRRHLLAGGVSGAAALVAGCSGSTNSSGGDPTENPSGETQTTEPPKTVSTIEHANIELSGWQASNEEQSMLRSLVKSFEKDHSNIDVDYSVIQAKYKQKMKTQLGAGNAPDVFYVDAKYAKSWASKDVLLNIKPYVQGDDSFSTDNFYEGLLEGFRNNGKLYGIPKGFSPLGMFYNTAHFEKAGVDVPTTWDEFRSALQAIKDAGIVKYPMIEYNNCRIFKPMVYQNGGRVLNEAGDECVVASDQNVETLKFIVGMKKDDLIAAPSQLGAGWHAPALGKEQVSTAVLGVWGLPPLENKFPKVDKDIDIADSLPHPSDGEKKTVAYTVSYSASANTDHKGASYRLISSLTSKKGAKRWAKKGLECTARKDLADIDYYKNHPRRQTMLKTGKHAKVVQYGTKTPAILNRLHPELEAAMLGKKSPRKALETAQQKINNEVF
ncbi:MAG: ABC transporter substrate-binding protein [Halapricum sp.]